jgi:hypothetical protein
VYFPGIGWVEFEPTAGQAPLERPLPPQDPTGALVQNPFDDLLIEGGRDFASREQIDEGVIAPLPEDPAGFQPIYLLPWLAIALALIVYLVRRYALPERVPTLVRASMERAGIDAPAWVVRWEQWVKLSPIERAFESINFGLRHLDQAVPVHITPVERAAKLTHILPARADDIKVLLDEHQTSLYTSRVADVTQARQAAFNLRKQVVVERMRYLFLGKPTS